MSKIQKLLKRCLPNLDRKIIAPNLETVTHTRPPDETPIMGPPRLPTELLIIILNYVYGRVELSRLCRTCRLFRTIVEPRLYHLHFRSSKWYRGADIHRFIQHARLELILNTVTLELYGWKYCDGQRNSREPAFLKNSRQHQVTCTCNRFDKMVGKALRHLVNLRTLRLDCDLCEVDSYQRHGWISTLETRSLHEINVVCWCSKTDESTTVEIFSSPPMNSVAMLGWHPHMSMFQQGGLLELRLMEQSILPNLRYLDHRGSDMDTVLLRHRPITRLSCALDPGRALNYEEMREKQGLTHLNIHCINLGVFKSLYLDSIAENPSPFLNLQHLGSFPLSSRSSAVSHGILTYITLWNNFLVGFIWRTIHRRCPFCGPREARLCGCSNRRRESLSG
jgi:hypothetical protein